MIPNLPVTDETVAPLATVATRRVLPKKFSRRA